MCAQSRRLGERACGGMVLPTFSVSRSGGVVVAELWTEPGRGCGPGASGGPGQDHSTVANLRVGRHFGLSAVWRVHVSTRPMDSLMGIMKGGIW
jgi:hypothetical protein